MQYFNWTLYFFPLIFFCFRREQLLNREKSASLDSGLSRSPIRRMRRSNTVGSPRGLKYNTKLNMGEPRDDVHVCIMCLRAIMNHQVIDFGIFAVFSEVVCSKYHFSGVGRQRWKPKWMKYHWFYVERREFVKERVILKKVLISW